MLVYQAHFSWGLRVQICRNQYGLTWSKLNPQVELCLGPLLASHNLIIQITSCKLNPHVELCLGPLLASGNLIIQITSSHFELLFIYGWKQFIFPPKWCHVDLALICHILVLDPHLKAMSPIYGCHPIRLLYFIGPWTLDPHLKWT
jgi:hypothetical protein